MKRITYVAAFAALLSLCALPALAANQLDVNGTAALEGSQGLEVIIDGADNLGDAYVVTSHPNLETSYNVKFLIDPSNLTLAATDYFVLGSIRKTNPPFRNFLLIFMRKSGNGEFWEIQTNVRDDGGNLQAWQLPVKICGSAAAIPCNVVAPVEFEFQWRAASAPGANDGSLRVFKNGTVRKEFLNLDNDGQTIDEAYFGAIFMVNGDHGAAAGSYYFDAFESSR